MIDDVQKVLFFLMGIQRSGGSTLLDAFKLNWKVSIFREDNKKIFYNYKLRPEKEIRNLLKKSKCITVIEAKSETKEREVADVLSEFANHTAKVIWNYRNPVSVYYSRLIRYPHKGWCADETQFCNMWNQRNASVIRALDHYKDDIAIVKLEDLAKNKNTLKELCTFIGANGRNTFYLDKVNVEENLPDAVISYIEDQTSDVFQKLELNRRFFP